MYSQELPITMGSTKAVPLLCPSATCCDNHELLPGTVPARSLSPYTATTPKVTTLPALLRSTLAPGPCFRLGLRLTPPRLQTLPLPLRPRSLLRPTQQEPPLLPDTLHKPCLNVRTPASTPLEPQTSRCSVGVTPTMAPLSFSHETSLLGPGVSRRTVLR